MNWKRLFLVVCLLGALFVGAAPKAAAQAYRFTVDRNISHVYANSDGSATIEYALTFSCAPGAHPIDIIDVGLPNNSYDLDSAQAWFSPGAGGEKRHALTKIYKSSEVAIGVEVHLGQYTIKPGSQGTLMFRITVREMVYADSKDQDYASLEFAPTFYGKKYTRGETYLEINLHFPPGLSKEEPRYHKEQYHKATVQDGRFVFTYIYPNATGYETHRHGISFPRKYVDKVYKAPLMIGGRPFDEWVNIVVEKISGFTCFGGMVLFFILSSAISAAQSKKRKMKYLPPALSVEGVGIKRGLTAVEAAILLETPLDKVMTMILFGILKKKGVVVLSENPLKLEKVEPAPKVKWRDYETTFLESIKSNGKLDEKKLQKMVVALIKNLNKKLKGFSRKETVDYYKTIVDRAWKQVQADTTPEVKSRHFDQGLEWMMLDKNFDERTEKTFQSGPVYMPPWWAYYRPWRSRVNTSRIGGGTGSPGRSGGKAVTLPTLPGSAFAGAIVSGIETTAGGIVSKVENFTGGITRRTNPPPVSSSGGGSSSGGCACACACAGCACACAGGGR